MPRVIVLVEPENPLNIGFVARAMKCSGVDKLRIVSQTRKVDDAAYRTGTSAKEILDSATFFDRLEDAMNDCHRTIAFSRRTFTDSAENCLLENIQPKINSSEVIAFVFGRESQGLFREEVALCSIVCRIPIDKTMSYNLGQAVSVALYESELRNTGETNENLKSASIVESDRNVLFETFSKGSEDFLLKGNRKLQLRKIISSLSLTVEEYSLIMGTLKSKTVKSTKLIQSITKDNT